MDSEAIRTPGSIRLKRDLSREAVNLALQGEWERATEVNKDILELFAGDVEAMNRLVKALIELGSYLDARAVLNQVCEVAPYNNIAKKNLVRLDQLTANPGSANPGNPKQTKKTAGHLHRRERQIHHHSSEYHVQQGRAAPVSQRPRCSVTG